MNITKTILPISYLLIIIQRGGRDSAILRSQNKVNYTCVQIAM